MSRPPDMSDALWDLTESVQFDVVAKSASDFEAKETLKNRIVFQANLQPTPPQKLLIKPEGQRSWRWWTMWTRAALSNDWILKDAAGRLFRVVSRSDWGRSGFNEYEITETVVPAVAS